MRTPTRWQVTGAVGVGLLGIPLLRLLWTGPRPPRLQVLDPSQVPFPSGRSQAALHEAAFWRVRAVQLADDDCDEMRAALKAWDPAAIFNQKETRRQFLAADRAGYLRRARWAARRAAALAQTPHERYRADRELTQLERIASLGAGLSCGEICGATTR